MPKPTTNTELVTQMMEFSNFGPLAQMVIIDSLTKHLAAIAKSKVEDYPDMGFIDPQTWINCAKDLQRQMTEFYARPR